MEKRWDILGIGTAAVDDVLIVDRFPQPDEKLPILARRRQGGGQTATALVTAARHAAQTAFCSCLGEDELSLFAYNELEKEGVDCSPTQRRAGCKPFYSTIIVEQSLGIRTILYHSEGVQEPALSWFDPAWVQASRLLFFDQNYTQLAQRAARIARQFKIPVVADLEYKPLPGLLELLPLIDHLIVGIDFAQKVTGKKEVEEMIAALYFSNQAACIVTAGPSGCWYNEYGGKVTHLPAFPTLAVETTGCGDIFHGAYAAAIRRGLSVPRSVQIASATASIKAAHAGGRAGIPGLQAVERFLEGA